MEIEYFIVCQGVDADRVASAKTMQIMHYDYRNLFTGIRCFKGIFSMQIKDDVKPYQAPPKHIAYSLQEVLLKELKMLQDQQILAPLGVDETVEWCNSFGIVPKPTHTAYLSLDPVILNQALTKLVHRCPTINDILPTLTNACYGILIHVSSGSHNLKHDKKSCYLTILHVSLAGIDSQDYCSGCSQWVICSSEKG